MGEYRDSQGLRCFEPDNDEKTLYIRSGVCLLSLVEVCKKKWPKAKLHEIKFTSEHINTRCIGYNRYDPMDYDDFIVATYEKV